MNNFLALGRNDLRSAFRDPVFKALLFFPFICFGFIRWALPVAVKAYPAMETYLPVIIMWACLQSATMFGFIYGFLFLEEKEENITQVINILPVSGLQLAVSRLLAGVFISAIVNFTLLHWGRVLHLSIYYEVLICVLFSMAAPMIALALATLSKNRIEGLAQMKIVNILMIIPALIYFLPYKAMHFLAVLPTYWCFRSMEKAIAGQQTAFFIFISVGFLFQFLLIYFLSRRLNYRQ